MMVSPVFRSSRLLVRVRVRDGVTVRARVRVRVSVGVIVIVRARVRVMVTVRGLRHAYPSHDGLPGIQKLGFVSQLIVVLGACECVCVW